MDAVDIFFFLLLFHDDEVFSQVFHLRNDNGQQQPSTVVHTLGFRVPSQMSGEDTFPGLCDALITDERDVNVSCTGRSQQTTTTTTFWGSYGVIIEILV